jgi:orotate phosphoribosyltransferase
LTGSLLAKFAARSDQPELIDGTSYTDEELVESLADIRRVNRWLGGTRALTRHLFPMIERLGQRRLRLLDVGTGSADIPATIVEWGRGRGIEIDFVVLDLNELAAREARAQTAASPEIRVVQADAMRLPFADQSFDFVLTTLFLHHLNTAQAARVIRDFARVARVAFIINDLRRHPVAYYSIKALTRIFTRNRLVRHDAAVSVLRGFTEGDLLELARAARTSLRIFRHFPYRFILIGQSAGDWAPASILPESHSSVMKQNEVLQIFEESGALLRGHFLLSSGLHSDRYLQCALVLQTPATAEKLCAALAAQARADALIGAVDLVIAPALGGIIVAHEVARALGVRALFTERDDKRVMTLRRGFRIEPGERAFVVEDVVTTGGSTREVMEVVLAHGGVVVGAGSLIDRSGGAVELGVPRHALAVLEVPTYRAEDCPMCAAGSTAIKPGSR